jgi:hypothetical protein
MTDFEKNFLLLKNGKVISGGNLDGVNVSCPEASPLFLESSTIKFVPN